jgi:type II secretory pathway component PulF
MAEFRCRVATATGEILERTFESRDEVSLRRELEAKDYLILDVRTPSPLASRVAGLFRFKPRVSAKEFLLFNQELAALLRAGLPVLQSLDILLERRENPTFKAALQDIRERVKSGESLSEAFSAQGGLFPRLYAATLASGERSGELHTVLRRYIEFAKNLLAVRKKVVSALVYPIILVTLMVALMNVVVFYVLPKFQDFLGELNTELPLPTVILLSVAEFAVEYWPYLVGLVVGGFVLVALWRQTEGGKLALDRMSLRIPLVGGIINDYAQNRFTRTLATLQAGGIPLVQSVEMAARAVGNRLYETRLFAVAGKVREGQSLWESVEETGLTSHITVEMIKVGESAGALVAMIRNGVVSSIVNFGAFVDLGGVDGLVHVSELSWKHIDHPSEVVAVGDEVTVEVLDVDMDRERVSLSLKSTQEDPWQHFARTHQMGQVVPGKVTKLVPFGAFVRVEEGIEGLVHISELAERHVEIPEQVVTVNDDIFVKVIDIDLERRRISLSLKQANENTTGAGSEEFDPYLYGMAPSYDEAGTYIGPEGFDPETGEWKAGFEDQRAEWEAQYAEAHARWEQHMKQVEDAKQADQAAALETGEGVGSYSSTPQAEPDTGGTLATDEALQALREKLTGGS